MPEDKNQTPQVPKREVDTGSKRPDTTEHRGIGEIYRKSDRALEERQPINVRPDERDEIIEDTGSGDTGDGEQGGSG